MPLEEYFFTKLQQCVSPYRDVQGLKEKKKKNPLVQNAR